MPRDEIQRAAVLFPRTMIWLISVLLTLAALGGAGWLTNLHGQVQKMEQTADKRRETEEQRNTRLELLKQQVETLDRKIEDLRGDVKGQGAKLDELLRRSR